VDSSGNASALCAAVPVATPLAGNGGGVVQTATITVDGSTADWTGIAPVITDTTGDSATAGTDISRVYLAKDASNIYARIDLANGTPAGSLYFGIGFISPQHAGDRFIFVNIGNNQCSVESRISDTGGYHTFVASGAVAVNGSTIEISVPRASLNPPASSEVGAWVDADGPTLDWTQDVTASIN
jgi:hypothetical protein